MQSISNLARQEQGMTLTSVLVGVILMGIVGQAIIQLFGNQAMAMKVVTLREQREDIMKHYKNALISGWDSTRQGGVSGALTVNDRAGTLVIPAAGLHLANDIYNPVASDTDGWWKVTAEGNESEKLEVTQSDSYEESEGLVTVTLTVAFEAKDHPVLKGLDLVERVEKVFFHHNISGGSTKATECGASNPEHESKLHDKDSITPKHKLYSSVAGAIVQYDFASNHAKCSQVPLLSSFCSVSNEATFGFKLDLDFSGTPPPEGRLQTGESLCSTNTTHIDTAIGDFSAIPEKERITLEEEDCNPGRSDNEGGYYITKIDTAGVPTCSTNYIAPEPQECRFNDPHSPNNRTSTPPNDEDVRGGVRVVNSDGTTECIDRQVYENARGVTGRAGRVESDGTITYPNGGCPSPCESGYEPTCPVKNRITDLAARESCP